MKHYCNYSIIITVFLFFFNIKTYAKWDTIKYQTHKEKNTHSLNRLMPYVGAGALATITGSTVLGYGIVALCALYIVKKIVINDEPCSKKENLPENITVNQYVDCNASPVWQNPDWCGEAPSHLPNLYNVTYVLKSSAYPLLQAIGEPSDNFVRLYGSYAQHELHKNFVDITNNASVLYHHKPLAHTINNIAQCTSAGIALVKEENFLLANHFKMLGVSLLQAVQDFALGFTDGFIEVGNLVFESIKHPLNAADNLRKNIIAVASVFKEVLEYLVVADSEFALEHSKIYEPIQKKHIYFMAFLKNISTEIKQLSIKKVGHLYGSTIAFNGVEKSIRAMNAFLRMSSKQGLALAKEMGKKEITATFLAENGVPIEYAVEQKLLQTFENEIQKNIPVHQTISSKSIFTFSAQRLDLFDKIEAEFLKGGKEALRSFEHIPMCFSSKNGIINSFSSKVLVKCWDHIFSPKHVKGKSGYLSIMDISTNQANIASMLVDTICYADELKKLMQDSINTIYAKIYGKNIIVRITLNNQNNVINVNAFRFKDIKPRPLGHILELGNIQ